MGNNTCTKICSNKKNGDDLALPTIKSMKNGFDPEDILKVVHIQRFFKILKYRRAIRNQILEIKNEKRKSVREQICNFKDSWELFFKGKATIEFSINGLQKVKNEMNEYYTKLTKLGQLFGVQKECTITMSERRIQTVRNSESFMKEFKIPMLKYLSDFYQLGELQYELDKYHFVYEKVKFQKNICIEENNTLENEENVLSEENKKSEENKIKIEIKQDLLENSNLDEEKIEDPFYSQKFKSLVQNNNHPIVHSKESGNNQNFNMNNSEIWFKKDTMSSNKTNFKTNCTGDISNRNASPPDFFKRREGKRTTITSNDAYSFSLSLVKTTKISSNPLNEKSKIPLVNSGNDYSKSKSLRVDKKYNANSMLKLEYECIIEKITEEKDKDCKYISFMDKSTSIFYQGSWHLKKLCKYGLGSAYMIDSSKGTRYKYYGYFKDDVFHGIGLLLYEDGYFYYGEFRNGFQTGFGVEVNKQSSYTGFFKNAKYHGLGEYKYTQLNQKVTYCGNYLFGQRDGYGILTLSDGAIYCGSFKNNKMEGIGSFTWPSGHKYYGSWRSDKMHGLGSYKWAKGDRYVGCYENDLRHGQGEYYFKNEAILFGFWRFSKKEGRFELHEAGHVYVLNYRNDVQIES